MINGSRRSRIAAGSGTSVTQVNELLERFKQAQAFMRQVPGLAGMARRGSAKSVAKASGKRPAGKRKKRR